MRMLPEATKALSMLMIRDKQFVDRAFAETSVLNEVLIDSGTDHNDVINLLPNSELSRHLISLITSIPLHSEESANERIGLGNKTFSAPRICLC